MELYVIKGMNVVGKIIKLAYKSVLFFKQIQKCNYEKIYIWKISEKPKMITSSMNLKKNLVRKKANQWIDKTVKWLNNNYEVPSRGFTRLWHFLPYKTFLIEIMRQAIVMGCFVTDPIIMKSLAVIVWDKFWHSCDCPSY